MTTDVRYLGSKVEDDRITCRCSNVVRREYKAIALADLNREGGLYIYNVNVHEFGKKKRKEKS